MWGTTIPLTYRFCPVVIGSEVGILGHVVVLSLVFSRLSVSFSIMTVLIYLQLHPLQYANFHFFDKAIINCEATSPCGFTLYLSNSRLWTFFHLCISFYIFREMFFSGHFPIFNWVIFLLFLSSIVLEYFSHPVGASSLFFFSCEETLFWCYSTYLVLPLL